MRSADYTNFLMSNWNKLGSNRLMADFYYKEMGKDDDIICVVLSGRLDAEQCEYLLHCVQKQIENGCSKLILDCDGLEYISSMGLGMLMRVHSRMSKQGGDVKLACVRGIVAEGIKLVRLDKVLEMYTTVEEAVNAHDG